MKTKTKHREGGILVLVMVLVLIVGGLGAGLMQLGTRTGVEVSYAVNDANAFWAAEAGIERAKTIGQKNRKRFEVITKPGSGNGVFFGYNVLTGGTSRVSYSVDILEDAPWVNADHTLKKYLIQSVGVSGGRTRIVKIHAKLLNYAGYMHASHDENGVSFVSGDILDGPVYTDDILSIRGPSGPVFKQLVSSGASYVDTNGWNMTSADRAAVFQGGLALNAEPLDIQGQFGDHITDIQTESQLGGLNLEGSAAGDYDFTFLSNGKVVYQKRVSKKRPPPVTNMLSSLNGTIYVDGDVYVKGVVNGKVTLASRHTINIVSNIVYESASGGNPEPWNTNTFNYANVNDMLGLMAVDSVNVMGKNSINIHASIMITSGGFNADENETEIGNKFINLFGGMSQYSRGVIGHNTSPFQGFHKNYKFDERYGSEMQEAPPSFPPSKYEFSSWE
jgi:hypothetical protein